MTEDKFDFYVYKVKQKHGDVFDFTKANPNTVKDKMCVTCKKHNIDFETTFDSLIHNNGNCPVCSGKYRGTEDFIIKIKEIHGDKYDLSKVKYTNARSKVTVVCHEKDEFGDEHGEFEIRACNLLCGIGCPKCGGHYTYTLDEWKRKANKVHNGKYIYDKVTSTKIKDKIEIICPIHGSFFQTAGSHLQGCGCPECNGGTIGNKEEFVEKANEVHHGYYDYKNFIYVNRRTKGAVTCPIHGDFLIEPDKILHGVGCPKCKSSKLENILIARFNKENINYEYQSSVLKLGRQTVDFYLNGKNIIIECQGEQHYTPVRFTKKMTDDDAKNLFEERKRLDAEKYDKAKKLGIEIIYFVIPSYFIQNNVSIDLPFYKDKKVFTQVNELVEYINSIENYEVCDNFKKFVIDIKNHVTKDIVQLKNNMIKSKDFIIHFVPIEHNDRDSLNSISRMYRKKGINVIHVFEDEYINCRKIVISKLIHILKTNTSCKKVFARKCTIKEIKPIEAFEFLTKNHIQGPAKATVHLGAYYNETLVGVMSFLCGKNNAWELVRFASDNNYICCGIGGKLFNYFVNHYSYSEIKSFADKRWTYNSLDNIYTKLGFELDSTLMPEYRYYKIGCEDKTRHHKFGFRKQKLNKKYGLDMKMTELEMTKKLGYDRIWDCGLIKYIYKNPNYL